MKNMREFFDACAEGWDEGLESGLPARRAMCFLSGIQPEERILDIACGTGVMFTELLSYSPKKLLGIDISPAMLERAKKKFPHQPELELFCGDVMDYFGEEFDRAFLYNAYPHFLNREALIKKIASLLKKGGRFTIAHSMGKERLNAHHAGVPAHISSELRDVETEAALWAPYFHVEGKLDLPDFYLITGSKK